MEYTEKRKSRDTFGPRSDLPPSKIILKKIINHCVLISETWRLFSNFMPINSICYLLKHESINNNSLHNLSNLWVSAE